MRQLNGGNQESRWIVRGYGKHGVYQEVVIASNPDMALRKGKPLVNSLAFGRIKKWVVEREFD